MIQQNYFKQERIAKIGHMPQQLKKISLKKMILYPSVVHLSSFIQSARKRQINQEFLDIILRKSSTQKHNSSFNSAVQLRKKKELPIFFQIDKREIQTSQRLKKRRIFEDRILLSELTDQKCNKAPKETQALLFEKDFNISKRRNYVMRKQEFKNFLREQSMKRNNPIQDNKQLRQVTYENSKIKKEFPNFNWQKQTRENALRRSGLPRNKSLRYDHCKQTQLHNNKQRNEIK